MFTTEKNKSSKRGIRIVSLFEGAKGLLVLLVGFGLLEFIHKDLHSAAEEIVNFSPPVYHAHKIDDVTLLDKRV